MNLKKLFIVRHGDYLSSGEEGLSPLGIRQMESIGAEIKTQHINGTKPRIITSTATRAKQSADILTRILEVEAEEHEVLWSENRRPPQVKKVFDLIDLDGPEVVIMVTHLEYTELLPLYFGVYALGGSKLPYREIRKGSAYVIDCEEKIAAVLVS